MPPLEFTLSVAGVLVTLKIADMVWEEVSPDALKTCCAAAPGIFVPFSCSVRRLETGYDASDEGETEPLNVAR